MYHLKEWWRLLHLPGLDHHLHKFFPSIWIRDSSFQYMQWFKVETSWLELLWEFHHPHNMRNVMTVSVSYHPINVTQDDVRWCNLSIQVIHITLPKENLDASGWTATAFSNKGSIISSHMSNNLVNHFDLQQLETQWVGLHMM